MAHSYCRNISFLYFILGKCKRIDATLTAGASRNTNGTGFSLTIQTTTAKGFSWTGSSSLAAASAGATRSAPAAEVSSKPPIRETGANERPTSQQLPPVTWGPDIANVTATTRCYRRNSDSWRYLPWILQTFLTRKLHEMFQNSHSVISRYLYRV